MQLQFGIQGVQLIPVGQSSAVVGWLKENQPQRHAESENC